MRELVGNCTSCGKEIFCLDGFFNGILLEGNTVYCFNCAEKESNLPDQSSTEKNRNLKLYMMKVTELLFISC